jgi:hypothetical protein
VDIIISHKYLFCVASFLIYLVVLSPKKVNKVKYRHKVLKENQSVLDAYERHLFESLQVQSVINDDVGMSSQSGNLFVFDHVDVIGVARQLCPVDSRYYNYLLHNPCTSRTCYCFIY